MIDASALVDASLGRGLADWSRLLFEVATREQELVAPELLWFEAVSAVRETAWRGTISREQGREAFEYVLTAPIRSRRPADLQERAWEIAERLGWAKTYDAVYCALAEILRCDLVTTDARLRSAGTRLGYVFTPREAAERLASP